MFHLARGSGHCHYSRQTCCTSSRTLARTGLENIRSNSSLRIQADSYRRRRMTAAALPPRCWKAERRARPRQKSRRAALSWPGSARALARASPPPAPAHARGWSVTGHPEGLRNKHCALQSSNMLHVFPHPRPYWSGEHTEQFEPENPGGQGVDAFLQLPAPTEQSAPPKPASQTHVPSSPRQRPLSLQSSNMLHVFPHPRPYWSGEHTEQFEPENPGGQLPTPPDDGSCVASPVLESRTKSAATTEIAARCPVMAGQRPCARPCVATARACPCARLVSHRTPRRAQE